MLLARGTLDYKVVQRNVISLDVAMSDAGESLDISPQCCWC